MAARRGLLLVALALLAMLVGCGGDDATGTAAGDSTATRSVDTSTFCDAWNAAMASGNDAAFDKVLADVPRELEDEAAVVREAEANGAESPEAAAAGAEIVNWTELHCQRGEAGRSQRRIAPPIEAELDGLTFCGTNAFPRSPPDDRSGMVLYGPASAQDAYDGPMLGVFWNPGDDGGHGGDGDSQPVTVRGESGVAAPITVFQQTIVPELGTVIAWNEGDRAVGLYGRRWPIDRASELVEMANQLEEAEGGFRLPDDALPDDYGEVFSGDPSVTSIVLPPAPLYALRYQGEDGLLDVSGLELTEEEFEAFRFFTIGVDQGVVAGHDGLVGNAWHEDGPAVVTWREPDGLVVRIVGIGVPLEAAQEIAAQSRELTDEEWTALVTADDRCVEG